MFLIATWYEIAFILKFVAMATVNIVQIQNLATAATSWLAIFLILRIFFVKYGKFSISFPHAIFSTTKTKI